MNCYKCGHEVPDGQEYCQFCGLKLEKAGNKEQVLTASEQTSRDSSIGSALKVFSIILMVVDVFGSIILAGKLGGAVAIAIFVADLLICMLCYGIGEICCLLKSINAKLK